MFKIFKKQVTRRDAVKTVLILLLVLFSYSLIVGVARPALPESKEQAKPAPDYLAIVVNAVTIVGCALGIAGTIWSAGKESIEAQVKIRKEFAEDLKAITSQANAKNDEGFQRDLQTKQELTIAINNLTALLAKSTADSTLAITNLRHDLEKSIAANLTEITKVHHKFEVAIFETESALESHEKGYKHLDEKISLTNSLAEQRHINLQKELQVLLRQFHYRLNDSEKVLEKELNFKPRREAINVDIEAL